MEASPFSKSLRERMNAAALRGNKKDIRDFVSTATREEAYAFFVNPEDLYKTLEDAALNKNAAVFEKLLSIYKNDNSAMHAIMTGFERDEKFNSQPNYDDRFGPAQDHADLGRKRRALLTILKP